MIITPPPLPSPAVAVAVASLPLLPIVVDDEVSSLLLTRFSAPATFFGVRMEDF